jgi:toxin YoeB
MICWGKRAWADYLYWQETDPVTLHKINELIRDISRSPFKGIGKPEPLRDNLSGWWSRRIASDHRLLYRVSGKTPDQRLEIGSCRYHYVP